MYCRGACSARRPRITGMHDGSRESFTPCGLLLQEGDDEDDDRWVMEQVNKGARSVPSASAISSLNLNGR